MSWSSGPAQASPEQGVGNITQAGKLKPTDRGPEWSTPAKTANTATSSAPDRFTGTGPTGLTGPGRNEWIATCIVGVLAMSIIAGGGTLMMARGVFSLPAAALIGLALLYLPLLWQVIRSGGPQPFDPEILHNANAPSDEAGR